MNPSAIQTPTRRRKQIAIAGIAVLIMVVILSTYLIAGLNRARETANRVKCNKQMRALGQAMFLYANEYRGAWPPALEDLILTQDITPEIFVCPSSNDTRAPGVYIQAAANLSSGGHLSYVYIGQMMKGSPDPALVVMYEPMTNHGNGFHALFADGHNEFLTGRGTEKIHAELQSGQNPPPSHR
ncbi:MAG: hypothetical protein JWN40_2174 [Phycisphaerales bacterium]|nr:hypothetical protein [Phycisphaerales bacterium]